MKKLMPVLLAALLLLGCARQARNRRNKPHSL